MSNRLSKQEACQTSVSQPPPRYVALNSSSILAPPPSRREKSQSDNSLNDGHSNSLPSNGGNSVCQVGEENIEKEKQYSTNKRWNHSLKPLESGSSVSYRSSHNAELESAILVQECSSDFINASSKRYSKAQGTSEQFFTKLERKKKAANIALQQR